MTPFANMIHKEGKLEDNGGLEAHFYDFTPVVDLLSETAQVLTAKYKGQEAVEWIEHGGLFIAPESHTKVKAHWRGDPSLGIHISTSYRVKP